MAVIACQGLTKRYKGLTALDGLDLSIEQGAVFGFLGPNGAGKTTTLRILTGLATPSAGQAWVAGEPVQQGSSSLHGQIGYLPESPTFYNWMTGLEYLTFVGRLFQISPSELRGRCEQLLSLAGLAEAGGRRISGYSRGMKQRLGIAQALVNRPPVLFLDEPCSALDPLGRLDVLETILRLKEQVATVFMSSHILADVERVCDTVGIVDRGRLLACSGVEELRQRFARPVFDLEFEEPAGAFTGSLRAMPWVVKVDIEAGSGSRLRVHAGDVATAKRELPGLAAASGLVLRHYHMELPSLEDVFVQMINGGGAA